MNKTQQFFGEFKADIEQLKTRIPDTLAGFGALFSKVMKNGALTVKEKELIALGIGVALRCESCIRSHIQKCLEAGASDQQVLEAASVAVVMAGGPAYVHLPVVLETLKDLQEGSSDKK